MKMAAADSDITGNTAPYSRATGPFIAHVTGSIAHIDQSCTFVVEGC